MENLLVAGAARRAKSADPQPVLFVGELNPYGSDPQFALYCLPERSAGGRLQSHILAMPRADYLDVWRTNLCTGQWSVKKARQRVAELLAPDTPWDVLVLLGTRVQAAFAHLVGSPIRSWTRAAIMTSAGELERGRNLIAIPHPSGLCRAWNALGSIELARRMIREVAPQLPIGNA